MKITVDLKLSRSQVFDLYYVLMDDFTADHVSFQVESDISSILFKSKSVFLSLGTEIESSIMRLKK